MSRSVRGFLVPAVLSLCACASEFSTGATGGPDGSVTGGANNSGGVSGGRASGGTRAGGGSGGASGATGSAGSNAGGANAGGAATGGALGVGGSVTGGATGTGGASTGGAVGGGGASTGGATGSGGISTGGAMGNGGANASCQPILNQANLDTGFENCSDGSKRRRAALQCPEERTTIPGPCAANPNCKEDADCSQQPNGYCAEAHNLAGYCGCYYGCRQDSDCGAGSICECGVVIGRCVSATCKTNADCGAGYGCVGTLKGTAGTTCNTTFPPLLPVYVCQKAGDLCSGDKDCPNGGGATQARCLYDGDHLACGLVCLPTP